MIDTGFPIRSAYFNALNGNITINAQDVPVYDYVPSTRNYPFIVLYNQDENGGDVEARSKDNKNATEVFFEIHIVTGFKGGNKSGGKKLADDISSQVLSIVLAGTPLVFTGLENVTAALEASGYVQDTNESFTTITKELIIHHDISQPNFVPVPGVGFPYTFPFILT